MLPLRQEVLSGRCEAGHCAIWRATASDVEEPSASAAHRCGAADGVRRQAYWVGSHMPPRSSHGACRHVRGRRVPFTDPAGDHEPMGRTSCALPAAAAPLVFRPLIHCRCRQGRSARSNYCSVRQAPASLGTPMRRLDRATPHKKHTPQVGTPMGSSGYSLRTIRPDVEVPGHPGRL